MTAFHRNLKIDASEMARWKGHFPEPRISPNTMQELADALAGLRDMWVHVSLALKDQLAELPTAERDAVLLMVEQHLARMQERPDSLPGAQSREP